MKKKKLKAKYKELKTVLEVRDAEILTLCTEYDELSAEYDNLIDEYNDI